jgi:excisionase family DNA binding protein
MSRTQPAAHHAAMLTTKDVAARCAMSEKTVSRHVKAGTLRCYRLGRLVRFTETDVYTFIHARRDAVRC